MSGFGNVTANKNELFGSTPSVPSSKPSAPRPTSTSTYTRPAKTAPKCFLTADQQAKKMKECEEWKKKAKDAMKSSFFTNPDPLSAFSYYKKAAVCYKSLAMAEHQALMHMHAGKCSEDTGSFSSAASEYKNAGECYVGLDKYNEAAKAFADAGGACAVGGDMGRCGEYAIMAAGELGRGGLDEKAGRAFIDGVNVFVPAEINDMRKFDAEFKEAEEAAGMLVSSAFGPELCMKAVYYFLDRQRRSIPLALYCLGAVAKLREDDMDATQSLFRAYLGTSVLMLAMGDVVAAEKTYMEKHLQLTSYLSSDECKVAEDLIMAVKNFDGEKLEATKKDRLVNHLDPRLKRLVMELQVSGSVKGAVVRNAKKAEKPAAKEPAAKEPLAAVAAPGAHLQLADIVSETQDIDIGLGDDDDMDELAGMMEEMERLAEGMGGGEEEEEEDVEDDEIDLR